MSKISISEQTPATLNQITANKPQVELVENVMQGYFANSINAGMIKPITYLRVRPGTKITKEMLQGAIFGLIPRVPPIQKLKARFTAYFVPDRRVWKNALQFWSQKGGNTEPKIKEIPNIGGLNIPILKRTKTGTEQDAAPLTDTLLWRDCWASTYIPRYQSGYAGKTGFMALPKYSVLPLRGFVAIYNDMIRNKEYEEAWEETDLDGATTVELCRYLPTNILFEALGTYTCMTKDKWIEKMQKVFPRGRRQNGYDTDYRTELLGGDATTPTDTTLDNLTEWEKKIADLRTQAENAQKNDWEIIAEQGGCKQLTEGLVQKIGETTIGLNYNQVVQTNANTNDKLTEEFQSMGAIGAYTRTDFNITPTGYQQINEPGYIHIIMQISADTVFETGFNRTELNVSIDDQYRPDVKDLTTDVLYNIESCGTRLASAEELTAIKGYKRKYSEEGKLPNTIAGEMTTHYYIDTQEAEDEEEIKLGETQLLTNHQYQFFEVDDKKDGRGGLKNIWMDYSDEMVNKDLVNIQPIKNYQTSDKKTNYTRITGHNQFYILGMHTVVASLPLSAEVKSNFKKWGEK